MEMIAHQTIRVNLPAGLAAGLAQRTKKLASILLIMKNRLAPITPAYHVIAGTFVLNSQRSRHPSEDISAGAKVSIISSDPFCVDPFWTPGPISATLRHCAWPRDKN